MRNWNLFLKVGLVVLVMGSCAKISGQTNQFFDGSGIFALSDSRWATTCIAGTSAFTSGNIVNFCTVNGTCAGGSIIIGGITATENLTLSSPSGTISNASNGVVIIDVSSGKTLDFSSQPFTTSATAGYTKNNSGTLALAGNTYGGGFTLNSGTIIVRGVNAMGGGVGNTLTINGGIIAANATRDLTGKYSGGITFGGNFALGATTGLASSSANLTFTNNVNLGDGSTRTITIGGTGTYSFSGIVSGVGSNLVVNSSAAGTISLTGACTYSGLTTMNGGTLSLGRTEGNTIPTTNNVVVNGGTLLISTSQTLNNLTITSGGTVSIATGATLTVDGTIDCAATGIVSGAGNFTLPSGATIKTASATGIIGSITVSGVKSFDSAANYEFQGSSTGTFTTTPDANTVNNLTINTGSGVALGQDLTVAGTLTLTAGRFNIGAFNLTSNTISGAPAWSNPSAKYIIAEGSGKLSRNNGTDILFPIGTSADYMPCQIDGGSGTFAVNLSNPTSGLDETKILKNNGTLTNAITSMPDISFQWPPSSTTEGSNFPTTGDIKLYKYSDMSNSWSIAGTTPAPSDDPKTASFLLVNCCSGFTVGAENALPVELVTFKGALANKKVNLTWQTASELNNSHFSIERSTNGTTFREIGTVQGQGTSYELNDYSFTDESPARGLNYYRLKQVDFDDNFEYSKVVSVNFGGGKGQVQLFPTVASSEIQVRFPAPTEDAGTIQVFDQSGKLVKLVSFDAELSDLPISVEEFQSGVYFVKVQNGQLFETLRFVKQ
ncbi:MAG: T9SS type A sorting domain-containing protein [Saprospiraceae bacterium]|nr:T9SS type A sorting domain-containing protein [Saprospiraceae bacterium]